MHSNPAQKAILAGCCPVGPGVSITPQMAIE
jgi:hypothetical protein